MCNTCACTALLSLQVALQQYRMKTTSVTSFSSKENNISCFHCNMVNQECLLRLLLFPVIVRIYSKGDELQVDIFLQRMNANLKNRSY
jgi:hypothetical protein